ncbi:MAG TPA: MgtC/SapB family protein [Chitinophagales bacterium]|nr:MgtC/SapB family protein [Chitinophagales bacterium]
MVRRFLKTAMISANTFISQILSILLSIVIGSSIGMEREFQNKSAGLRTFILVSFGSCLFTILSIAIGINNPDRLAANIVTGIGFLGAGIIYKESNNKIGGITTASAVWATASLGMCAGAGYFTLAALGTVILFAVLRLMVPLQNKIEALHKIQIYTMNFKTIEGMAHCEQLFAQFHLKYKLQKQTKTPEGFIMEWHVSGKQNHHDALVRNMIQDDVILSYSY